MGVFNSNTGRVSGFHTRYVIYVKAGKIYRVNALKSGPFAPTQVSSEIAACPGRVSSLDTIVDNSIYSYSTPGGDGSCSLTSDNVQKMVTVGMLSTDAPILMGAKRTIDLIYNPALSVVGLLVEEAGVLKSCDVALTTCATVMSGITSVQKMGENKLQAKTYLRITTTSLNFGELYVYDGATGTLSSPLYTFTIADFNLGQIDSTHFFFHDNDKIFKLAHSNNALVTVFTIPPGGVIWSVKLTNNRVVYTKNTSTTNEMRSVLKNGNSDINLVSVTQDDAISPWAISANNRVYYTKYIIAGGGATTTQSAGHIPDDGNGGWSELLNSAWIGGSIPTTFSVVVGLPLEKIIRVEGCALLVCAGGPLKSFVAATFGSPITLGAVPSDIDVFSANFGLGSDLLGNGSSSAWQSDVFYLNPDTANSLVRITTTALDELPLW